MPSSIPVDKYESVSMEKKECYFGAKLISINGIEALVINGCVGATELYVRDVEKAYPDGLEAVEVEVVSGDYSYRGKRPILTPIIVHKKDCLPLALFLLAIHAKYAGKENEVAVEDFVNRYHSRQSTRRATAERVP